MYKAFSKTYWIFEGIYGIVFRRFSLSKLLGKKGKDHIIMCRINRRSGGLFDKQVYTLMYENQCQTKIKRVICVKQVESVDSGDFHM